MGEEAQEQDTYIFAIRSTHELLQNCGYSPVSQSERIHAINFLEKLFFRGKTIPLVFRELSDVYMAKGLDAF